MKKEKGNSSHRDYEHSITKLQVLIDKAKETLREQMRLRQIEESRRLLGGKEGIHLNKDI
jgi:predicted RNA binding protein YcfA (HicA-like mRNA interferase family)